jgi:hypothetical protein
VTGTTVSNFTEREHRDNDGESEEHFHVISLGIYWGAA